MHTGCLSAAPQRFVIGSNSFRTLTCFEEPLHSHCSLRVKAASNRRHRPAWRWASLRGAAAPSNSFRRGYSPVLDAALLRLQNLTTQPFRPKLRLSNHMQSKTQHIRILALLLGFVFLGAQFHFCADLTAAPSASHICPVCSTAGSVVATQSPVIASVPATNRLEIAPLVVSVSSAVPRATSPRAPPAL